MIEAKRRELYLQTYLYLQTTWLVNRPSRNAFQTLISQELLELNNPKFDHI